MSEYIYDAPETTALPRQYRGQTWPAQLSPQPVYVPATAQLGAESDQVKTIKDILIVVGICLLAYWLLFSRTSPLRNPRHGKNAIAKVSHGADGAWYWRLLRKGAKRHGPFGSAEEAESDAESAGHRVLT
jgi:hypothetical protein